MVWLPLIAVLTVGQGGVSLEMSQQASPVREPARHLDDPVQLDDVEVLGRRGAALTSPEVELDGADIDAFGAWNIEEVLQRMGETLRLGEQPLVLINGQPTPNVSAYTGFPPDALVRAEVLPASAAGLYGAAPQQRVVNLVLQSRYSSHEGRLVGARPSQGGTSSTSGDLRRSAIAGRNTRQVGLRLTRDTALKAGERDGYLADHGQVRDAVTLRPQLDAVAVNASVTRAFGDWSGVFTLSGQVQDSRAVVFFGEELVDTRRSFDVLAASAGFSGQAAGWFLQTNFDGRAVRSSERGIHNQRNDIQALTLAGSARRSLFDLPAGPLTASFNTNLTTSRSVGHRNGDRTYAVFQSEDFQGLLDIPLAKAGASLLSNRLLGDLTASLGLGLRQNDGGSGEEVRVGLSWAPQRVLRLNGEWSSSSESVPDILKTEPEYYGSPVVVYDFRTGAAVEILPIRGGDPGLRPPKSERLSLTHSLGPFSRWAASGSLSYQRAVSSDGIGALPSLTEDVEMAFPDRVRRDLDGRLISIDYRPMNLHSTLAESLSAGVNFTLPRPVGTVGADTTVLRVALNHSFQLSNIARLRAGLPEFDRLAGDGGGMSRQSARLMIDARRGRWGVNASAQWQGDYRTRRVSGRDGPDDLIIARFASVDLRFSYQMTPRDPEVGAGGGLPQRRRGGLLINFDVENLFDARREARLGDGASAPGYGRDVQDPLGRTVRLTLQRRF